jgi:hypothetical protein
MTDTDRRYYREEGRAVRRKGQRVERDQVRQRGGVGDQLRDRCEDCAGDQLPCFDCLRGDE